MSTNIGATASPRGSDGSVWYRTGSCSRSHGTMVLANLPSSRRLWARLIVHFWAAACSRTSPDRARRTTLRPDCLPTTRLRADRVAATSLQTTGRAPPPRPARSSLRIQQRRQGNHAEFSTRPTLEILQVMVIRPSNRQLVFKSTEQWHWFDCPRQQERTRQTPLLPTPCWTSCPFRKAT